MKSLNEQDAPSSSPISGVWSLGTADQWLLMWALLIVGVVLFLSAGIVGQWLTTHWDGYHYGWSPSEAAQIAWNIRAFAAMSFMGGLAERIALEIALLRRQMK